MNASCCFALALPAALALAPGSLAAATVATAPSATARPNILWITCEDIGPHLGSYGHPDAADLDAALATLLGHARLNPRQPYIAFEALNALDHLGPKARPVLPAVRALPAAHPDLPGRIKDDIPRLIEHLTGAKPEV